MIYSNFLKNTHAQNKKKIKKKSIIAYAELKSCCINSDVINLVYTSMNHKIRVYTYMNFKIYNRTDGINLIIVR
jgi:uncharacterized protein (UPF0276 family)